MTRITIERAEKAQQYQDLLQQHGAPLLVLDCAQLVKQYEDLSSALPGVDLFYAIKSLPHAAVIQTLKIEELFVLIPVSSFHQLLKFLFE